MKYFNHDMHVDDARRVLISYIPYPPATEEDNAKYTEVKAEYDDIIDSLYDADNAIPGLMTS